MTERTLQFGLKKVLNSPAKDPLSVLSEYEEGLFDLAKGVAVDCCPLDATASLGMKGGE